MKKNITVLILSLFIICSCKQTVDKKEHDFQIKINDSLQLIIKNQQTQIDTLSYKLESITTQIIFAKKAAPLTEYAFTKIINAMMRELSKRNLKEGFANENPKLARDVLIYSFDVCGYNYKATLHQVAQTGFTQNESGYVLICMLPTTDKKTKEEFKNVFQGQELEDVTKIFEIFKNINDNN